MTSINYGQVDVDLGDTMASSKFHKSQDYFKIYEHISICSYEFISDPLAGHFWPNVRTFILLKTYKL